MIDSDNLFRLIHSLDKSEKRYFKQFCKIHKADNNYIELFDYLVAQSSYEINNLKRHFHNSTISKFYPAIKKYLWDAIIKSLRSYHQDKLLNIKIRTHLDYAELLLYKGFHKEAAKVVKTAKSIANSYEKHALLLEALRIEREVAGASFEWGGTSHEQNYKEEDSLVKDIENKSKLRSLGTSISTLLTSSSSKTVTTKQLEYFKKIIDNEFVQKSMNNGGVMSKSLAQQMNINYKIYIKKFNEAHELTLVNYQLLTDNYRLFEESPDPLLNCLFLLCILNILLNNEEEFQQYVEKLRELASNINNPKFYNLKVASLDRVYALELEFYIEKKEFELAKNIIEDAKCLIDENERYISPERSVERLSQISFVLFSLKNYEEALNYLNEIINNYKKTKRKDQYIGSSILFVLCMIEICKIEKNDPYFLGTQLVGFKLYLRNNKLIKADEYKIATFLLWYVKNGFKNSFSFEEKNMLKKYKKLKLRSNYLEFNDWLAELGIIN